MKTVNLDNKRDFPVTTNALKFIQDAYGDFEQLVKLGGDNYILSGCVITGQSAASGWVVIGGRLMPFSGGSIKTNVKVVTTVNTITVGRGTREQTSYNAEFGTSTNPAENIAWTTLSANRIPSLLEAKSRLAALEANLPVYKTMTLVGTNATLNISAGVTGWCYWVKAGKQNQVHFKVKLLQGHSIIATFGEQIIMNDKIQISGSSSQTKRFYCYAVNLTDFSNIPFRVDEGNNHISTYLSYAEDIVIEGSAIWFE